MNVRTMSIQRGLVGTAKGTKELMNWNINDDAMVLAEFRPSVLRVGAVLMNGRKVVMARNYDDLAAAPELAASR
jgi:hypothetical protein